MRESQPAGTTVFGKNGLEGVLLDAMPRRPSPDDMVRVRLSTGQMVELPADMMVAASDGSYLVPFGAEDLPARAPAAPLESSGSPIRGETDEQVIPVIAEELVVDKRAVATGKVRVRRRVLEHEEAVELPLLKEHLEIRRVGFDREVDGPLPIRREGEMTIIPIVEEVLVIQKRYVLKEEIYVSKSLREELHREVVTVREQVAEVEHTDADGRPRPVPPAPVGRSQRRLPENE